LPAETNAPNEPQVPLVTPGTSDNDNAGRMAGNFVSSCKIGAM
jgi:hypothetical protein